MSALGTHNRPATEEGRRLHSTTSRVGSQVVGAKPPLTPPPRPGRCDAEWITRHAGTSLGGGAFSGNLPVGKRAARVKAKRSLAEEEPAPRGPLLFLRLVRKEQREIHAGSADGRRCLDRCAGALLNRIAVPGRPEARNRHTTATLVRTAKSAARALVGAPRPVVGKSECRLQTDWQSQLCGFCCLACLHDCFPLRRVHRHS